MRFSFMALCTRHALVTAQWLVHPSFWSAAYASLPLRDFLLKPELLRAISDLGFEHPSEGESVLASWRRRVASS